MPKMTLEFEDGGISYLADVDVSEDYVCEVLSVSVWSGTEYVDININKKKLGEFYAAHEDALNEAYEKYPALLDDIMGDEKFDREHGR